MTIKELQAELNELAETYGEDAEVEIELSNGEDNWSVGLTIENGEITEECGMVGVSQADWHRVAYGPIPGPAKS